MSQPTDQAISIELVPTGTMSFERAEAAARNLMEELGSIPRLPVAMAEGGPAPAGSKALGVGLAEILIGMTSAGALLPSALGVVRDWLVRQPPATTVKVKDGAFEVEWSGTTPPEAINDAIAKLLDRRASLS